MSLAYIIDGYNAINHPIFAQKLKHNSDPRVFLAEHIRLKKLCGSLKNKVILVFDGFPPTADFKPSIANIEILFSRNQSADDKIKRLLENTANPKAVVVVSDDREIKFFARSCKAHTLGIEEFMQADKEAAIAQKDKDSAKDTLSYSQMESINKELKKIWLK